MKLGEIHPEICYFEKFLNFFTVRVIKAEVRLKYSEDNLCNISLSKLAKVDVLVFISIVFYHFGHVDIT